MMSNQRERYFLTGVSAEPEMVQDIQRKLKENGSDIVILDMTATVYGLDDESALLTVEMNTKGHEWSSFIVTYPLRKNPDKAPRANKNFLRYVRYEDRKVVDDFFKRIAKKLRFECDGMGVVYPIK